ncbi:MAG: TPM domain-containing protein [Merismopediaceae bacterium]|nr:TPM domain-containing protein [Merismopediaceae bacterium]
MPVASQTTIPKALDLYVSDYAKVISPEDTQAIKDKFSQLKRDRGIEARVVTISTMRNYSSDNPSWEIFATRWFNTWGIGNAKTNTGILLLVALQDRKVRIELGRGFEPSYNTIAYNIIQSEIIPAFKKNQYSQGIRQGATAIARDFTNPTAPPPTPQSFIPPKTETTSTSVNPTAISLSNDDLVRGFFSLLAGGWAISFGLMRYLRLRQRRCVTCQTLMERLDETTDNSYLDEGQNLEEKIGSVDYDVWKCPSCGKYKIHHYRNWFSRHRYCPQCKYHTLNVEQSVITPATYDNSGTALQVEDCLHCAYHQETTVILPQLTHSSDSSSDGSSSSGDSSSDGGSSGGGGASGDW